MMRKWYDVFIGICGGVASYIWGDINGAFIALLVFIIMDYLTGVISAGVRHSLASNVGFIGILRKVIILVVVALGHFLDTVIQTDNTIKNMIILFYIANESLSILENVVNIGLPVPNFLIKLLETMKKENNKGGAADGSKNNI